MDMLTFYMVAEFASGFKETLRAEPMAAHRCMALTRRYKRWLDIRGTRYARDGRKLLVYCAPSQKPIVIAK